MATLVRFVAFIRAINVGGHVVKMADFTQYFVDMGFRNVSTVIASGNVIFDVPAARAAKREQLQARITARLSEILGFQADTFLRTPAELRAIAQRAPFGEVGAPSVVYVHFLSAEQLGDAAARLAALGNEVDEIVLDGLEMYWLQRRGVGESRVKAGEMARVITGPATSRNITTVRRVAEKAGNGGVD
jgi:uncharacterized protein (DUF1697 family)